MKKLGLLCSCLVLILSTNVNAALIDLGPFTRDDISGLDWLDLDVTAGMTMSSALASNANWRFATNSEVENLFGQLFEGYFANAYSGQDFASNSNYRDLLPYSGFFSQARNFISLFGITEALYQGGALGADVEYFSFGYYIDESQQQRIFGAVHWSGAYTEVYGLNYDSLVTGYRADPNSGTFLVRSYVPIPGAVWLFGVSTLFRT